MKPNKFYVAICLAPFFLSSAFAQQDLTNDDNIDLTYENDEIVFTANRADQRLGTVGSSIDVITSQELQSGQYQRVSDALATLPGVDIVSNGANGSSTTYIRGISSDYALVMIDGVIVNDPSTGGNGFDFSTLNTLNIERIEVLKGPQSILYGSNAIAGVIQIFTDKGGPQRTTLSIEGGSYEHIKTTLQTRGQTDTLMYSVALGLNQERGISVADRDLFNNFERDRFKNRDASFYVNYAPTDWINFDLMGRYDQQYTDLDTTGTYPNGESGPVDDFYYHQRSQRWLGKFAINTILFDEKWLSSFIFDASKTKRKYYNEDGFDSVFDGRSRSFTWQNTLTLHKDFQTLFGYSYKREEMFNLSQYSELPKKHINLQSFYLDQHLNFADRFFNTIGVRYDDHSEFGDKVTYRITSRFNFTDKIAIKGSYGTGFKAPSLYELYEPDYGNPDLKAQKSKGFDIGLVLRPIDSTEVTITYFNQKITDKILFDMTDWRYITSGKFKSKGVEISTNTRLNDQFSFGFNYTYIDAKDFNDDEKTRALRLPKNTVGGHLNFHPNENLNFYAEAKYHGTSVSNFEGSNPKRNPQRNLGSYWMVNLSANYDINDTLSIYGRINNLLAQNYYTAWGYAQKDINAAIGVKINF